MRRTPLNRIGKQGKRNLEANKKIKELNLPDYCEMRLEGCMGNWPLQNAHRHKRNWYYSQPELLYAYGQVVRACQVCHELTEHNRELNDEIFNKLRGDEVYDQ